jgi:4a-hydroxytetrahydrobiopterin dehydratase
VAGHVSGTGAGSVDVRFRGHRQQRDKNLVVGSNASAVETHYVVSCFDENFCRPSECYEASGDGSARKRPVSKTENLVLAKAAPHNGSERPKLVPEDSVMPAKKLSDAEITALLPKAKGWRLVDGKLHREFTSKDFVTAFGNMTRVALVAEAMNHHPEWSNVWNKVVIDLHTHSVKGISDYDFVLAEKTNEIFGA